MPPLNLGALLLRLREGAAPGVVLLHGDEEYLKEEALQRLLEHLLEPGTLDFNLDQVRGGDASPETLASLLGTPPMMAAVRVVVVRDAQHLGAKARAVVEETVARSAEGVVLILLASIPAGTKTKFYDTVKAGALSVRFPGVDPIDLPAWLIERAASQHDAVMDLDAARALSSAIGAQLGVLSTELEKLASYVGDRSRIALEDVQAVGGYIPRVDRWAWFDTVGERQFARALGELPELLDAGETGVGLVIGLGSHLLRLGMLVAGGRDGLERQLKPHQRWLVNRLLPQARRWTATQIDVAISDLLRTDRLLKSASLGDRHAMEELLLRLAAQPPEGRPETLAMAACLPPTLR